MNILFIVTSQLEKKEVKQQQGKDYNKLKNEEENSVKDDKTKENREWDKKQKKYQTELKTVKDCSNNALGER